MNARSWRRIGLIAACFTISAALGAARAEDKLPLSLSHAPIMPFTNGIVAAQAGYFDAAGLDAKRKVLASSDILRAALASGEVEIVAMSTDTLIRAHATGFDWKLVYQTDIYDSARADAILIGRSDMTFKTAKDLEGKTVGASPGTISESAVRGWMADNGADNKTLKVIDIPFAQIVGALTSKTIDAAHIVEPFMTVALENGTGKLAAQHLDAVSKRFLISGFVAQQSWIDANPEKIRRFIEGMNAATDHILKEPDAILPILAKETRIAPELLRKIFPVHYVISMKIRPDEIQSLIDFLARQKQIDHAFSYRDIVYSGMPMED